MTHPTRAFSPSKDHPCQSPYTCSISTCTPHKSQPQAPCGSRVLVRLEGVAVSLVNHAKLSAPRPTVEPRDSLGRTDGLEFICIGTQRPQPFDGQLVTQRQPQTGSNALSASAHPHFGQPGKHRVEPPPPMTTKLRSDTAHSPSRHAWEEDTCAAGMPGNGACCPLTTTGNSGRCERRHD